MIQLEFGDAMRRLRDGEALVATHPKRSSQTMYWDYRGLWVLRADGWVTIPESLTLIMTSTWHLVPAMKYPPIPLGPAPEPQ
jgi:hypothetical protein